MGRKKRAYTRASATVEEIPSVGQSPDMLIAEHEGRMVQDESEDGDGVVTTHTRPGTLVMYKPTETQGYTPRTVSGSAVRLLLRQGWREVCPDCNKRHVDKNGKDSTDPNLCSAREPLAVRVCRVCTKRIFDNRRFTFDGKMGGDDPNVIEDEAYDESTPEERTKASLNLHYWVLHPREAQMMNIPPLPTALRGMAETGASNV
ncbi:hypothetical protein LCGC14_0859320 [marine sediment metagenome]|uniref:Uncharacterized protein n=1 Tax=marine sediment metagenome TaxID=412755 RepID=A0A0F9PT68_9ZZZZ